MRRIVSIILIAVVLATIGAIGYIIATPGVDDKFSEFYILGLEGKANDYPKTLVLGEEARVIVGIINREYEIVSYWVEVEIDGVRNNHTGTLKLAHDEKWEEIVSFTPDRTGDNQKVEFILYKNGGSEPYLKLNLWVNVKE